MGKGESASRGGIVLSQPAPVCCPWPCPQISKSRGDGSFLHTCRPPGHSRGHLPFLQLPGEEASGGICSGAWDGSHGDSTGHSDISLDVPEV